MGLHVSSSVAHFVWKIKQFEFHIFFTVLDIKATAEKHITYMKTSIHLVFLRSEQPVCKEK